MNKTPSAWMLRRDGTAFPCQWHYYGNTDPTEVEETLYAAEWLYDATQCEETRQLCLDLIAAYGVALQPNRNLVRNLLLAIRERPYVFLSRAFVERHAGELFYVDPARLPELNAADADTVTVLWDQESTGHNEYLTDEVGRTLDHIPLQEIVQ